MGLSWWLTGLFAIATVVGIPWAKSCFVLAELAFFPFGKEVIDREILLGNDIGTGKIGFVGNIIWFAFAGAWLALGHLFCAAFCIFTVVGIPFGLQHIKLARLAISPVGKMVVDKRLVGTTWHK